jgi:Bifunctional DNA primase/polymerase, N-terminal
MTAGSMVDAAIALATAGWAVFPCREQDTPGAKSPYTEHGFKDAPRETAQILAWWCRWPCALIGAPLPDSLLVLDVDPRNGGDMAALTNALGPLPATLTAWSGRGDGGRHLYYMRPDGAVTSRLLPPELT